jgi:hypothetical protein
MTQPDRHTPDEANGAPAVPSVLPAAAPAAQPAPSAWEALFLAFDPASRRELLARARPGGVVYAHRIPQPAGNAGPPGAFPAAALLNGRSREFSPNRPLPVTPRDTDLDAEQREAVARALHTPDVCLISGVAGGGKSRVVVEILAQAAGRGERVLFLAPDPAALDRVLAALAGQGSVCALRRLAADETAERLPANVRALTLDARVRHFREQTVPQARAAAATARRRLDEERRQEALAEQLGELATGRAAVAGRMRDVDARRAALAEEIAASAGNGPCPDGPFAPELAAARREHDEAVTRLDARESAVRAELGKVRAGQDEVRADEAKLRALLAARQGFRFWTAAWWRSRVGGNLPDRLEQLQVRQAELEDAGTRRAEEATALARERAGVESAYRAALGRFVEAETERRSAGLRRERDELAAEEARLVAEWGKIAPGFDGTALPATASPADVAERRAARGQRLTEAEQALAAAERWASAAQSVAADIAPQLAGAADVVAATTAAIASDPDFGDRAAPFDLLVLEEADRLTETEFLRLSRRARRWVLVGEAATDGPPPHVGRPFRPAALRPGFFQRLWDNFHADPGQLPYAWRRREDGRLCCRLRPPAPDDRCRVETECVADRPDVELRIVTPARGKPELSEVVFPAATSAADAKAYVFRELDELPVESPGRGLRWSEEADRIVLWLSPGHPAEPEAVALAPGVTELIGPPGPHWSPAETPFLTYALAFVRAAGWSRDRAEDWAARHAGLRDAGRTAFLSTPHRMCPPLARFVTGLLDAARVADPRPDDSPRPGARPAVEFVPVPPLPPDNEPRRRGESDSRRRRGGTATAPRLKANRGGAGLETELAEARRPDLLPAELRGALPAKGLVNYLEARAVVQELEALAADAGFRAEAEAWRQAACGRDVSGPAVAVMALYPSQVELIRQLAARAPALAAAPLAVEFGTPDLFRHRECLAALVSLTRSHAHRPVSFGEGPRTLALALTRARARLLLFGDPGTLVRRGQCAEPVDHLDPAASARERGLVADLVARLQDGAAPGTGFRLRQGTGS